MRTKIAVSAGIVLAIICLAPFSYGADSSPWDWVKSKLGTATSTSLGDTQVGAGLKEALKVGIENTIKLLGKQDGYLANEGVKILLPQTIKNMEGTLRKMGLGPQIDEFVLSMNRAAEKSAPLAADVFASAIADMTIDDAQKILKGKDTAATDYLKEKTSAKLLDAFQPSVSQAMDDYAVTKKYEEILGKVKTLPFANKLSGGLDLDKYVSSKALDGLFKVLGEQEAKIRTDPAARTTELLKQVFGGGRSK